jgi:hypothetical protein
MTALVLIGLFLALAVLTLAMSAEDKRAQEEVRGWRLRFVADACRYEEKKDEQWRGVDIEIDRRSHSIIGLRFRSAESWAKYPAWISERRAEVIARVKQEYASSRFVSTEEPNQALEPTPIAVTPRADARVAPATGVAHL